jgi:hypothetical protein
MRPLRSELVTRRGQHQILIEICYRPTRDVNKIAVLIGDNFIRRILPSSIRIE